MTARGLCASLARGASVWIGRLAIVALLLSTSHPLCAQEPTLRLRIAWGGGPSRRMQAKMQLTSGSFANLRPLGMEADTPGSMWLDAGVLHVVERSQRTYNGVDVTVSAPLTARLAVELSDADNSIAPVNVEVPLAQLVTEQHNTQIDTEGNRLLIRRAPGDQLRVNWDGSPLIFAAGETVGFDVLPYLLGVDEQTRAHVEARLVAAGASRQVWSAGDEVILSTDPHDQSSVSFDVALPDAEGVYDLVIDCNTRRLPARLGLKQHLAQRSVQLVVLSAASPGDVAAESSSDKLIYEIDPANPRWWRRLTTIPKLNVLKRGLLGNGADAPLERPLATMTQLAPQGNDGQLGWIAYPLSIDRTGEPHVLEIEYAADVPQTLGISIVEPNAAGQVVPIGLDSGVFVDDDVTAAAERIAEHRLVFWPRTKTPIVLLTNRSDAEPATFGKIRVWQTTGRLKSATSRQSNAMELADQFTANRSPLDPRLLAGYYDRPLVSENFSAPESVDAYNGRSLDDWQTFYEGGSRLSDYLGHAGFNGLMLAVVADGSAIYPSTVLQATPRYDNGAFFASGQDPIQKDVLELYFRQFDRAGLVLIPTVHFSVPLPALEATRRQGGPAAEGIEWIGADGRAWLDTQTPQHGLAPYYNPLHPRVQQAMFAVLDELIDRYARHPSFGGLAVRLSADGYSQLLGPEWGVDDATIAQFTAATGIHLAAAGPERYAQRVEQLTDKYKNEWLDWRAGVMAAFHRRVQAELSAAHGGARLYLAPVDSFAENESTGTSRPARPGTPSYSGLLREVGIDPQRYQANGGIVLLRPRIISPPRGLQREALTLSMNESGELDRAAGQMESPASLFFHEPPTTRLESFDRVTPFRESYTWLVPQMSPSDAANRRRFVHSLTTLDARAMFDGGWLLPLGQEDSIRDLAVAYTNLPSAPFETLPLETHPVTIRTHQAARGTYVYLANDSPWPASVSLSVIAPDDCHLEAVAPGQKLSEPTRAGSLLRWQLELEPYGLVAGRWTPGEIRISAAEVRVPESAATNLQRKIDDLKNRATVLGMQPPLDVLENPGFELGASDGGLLAGWLVNDQPGVKVEQLAQDPHAGRHAVRLSSTGAFASLASHTFSPPASGRLAVRVWLRVDEFAKQPPLQLALEGDLNGNEFSYYQHARVGAAVDGRKIGEDWSQYEFFVDNLPPEGLANLRVRFDLMGEGAVWIDDVELDGMKFTQNELVELSRTIELADGKLHSGQIADCYRMLSGYWPRFLEANVALDNRRLQQVAARQPRATPAKTAPDSQAPEEGPGIMGRLKKMLPQFMQF